MNVFRLAGIWGILVLTPLFFTFDAARHHPQFYFGFLDVTMAWQIAFFVIASDPVRFRPMMIPAMLEKLGYVLTMPILYARSQVTGAEALTAVPDFVLLILFVVAYRKVDRARGEVRR
jgi:hypothetical protein